jgi:uncharacterized membrane protein YhhN
MSEERLVLLGAFAVAINLQGEKMGSPLAKVLGKVAASTLFMVSLADADAFLLPWEHRSAREDWKLTVTAAFICCWLGDVFLLSKKMTLFLLGLVTFLVGHIFYILWFLQIGCDWDALPWVVTPVLVAGLAIARWVIPAAPRKMKLPVALYVLVIHVMVLLACISQGPRPHIPLFAALFQVSDIFVAKARFIDTNDPDKIFMDRVLGLPLYYAAQFGFAHSARVYGSVKA